MQCMHMDRMCDSFRFSTPHLSTKIDMRVPTSLCVSVLHLIEHHDWLAFCYCNLLLKWLLFVFDLDFYFVCLEADRFFSSDIIFFAVQLLISVCNFYDEKENIHTHVPSSIQLSAKWSKKEMKFLWEFKLRVNWLNLMFTHQWCESPHCHLWDTCVYDHTHISKLFYACVAIIKFAFD